MTAPPEPSTTPATAVGGTSRPDGATGPASGGVAGGPGASEGTTDSGGQPGMGPLAGLVGVAGAGYLLGRSGDE
jgi:PGF-CTERM protein